MEERWSSLLALLVYVYSLISDQLVITIIINVLWGLKTCPSLEPIHQIPPSPSSDYRAPLLHICARI